MSLLVRLVLIIGLAALPRESLVDSKRSRKVVSIPLTKISVPTKVESNLFGSMKMSTNLRLKNFQNFYYTGWMKLGTPYQRVRLLYDTASSDLWVPSRSICQKDPDYCTKHSTYNHTASSTYEHDGRSFTIDYGSGTIGGMLVKDDISVAGLKIKSQSIGETTQLDDAVKSFRFDGIFGLGLPGLSKIMKKPPFLTMVEQGVVERPVFAFFLSRSSSNSVLTFGGVDRQYVRGKFTYASVTGDRYWLFKIDSISFDGEEVSGECNATPDSGSSLIMGPADIIDPINAVIGELGDDGNTYADCDTVDDLPTVDIVISGRTFSLTPYDYIVVSQDQPDGSHKCWSGFQSLGVDFVVLGDIFMAKYYTLFDFGNKRVGFATAKH